MNTTNFIQEHLIPIFRNIVDLGTSVERWRKIWTTDFDASGTVTVPTPVNNTDAATKAYVDTSPGAGLTVEEADGTPSYTGSTTLRFDQADGFVITQPAGAIARVDLAAIPNAALVTVGAATGGTGQTTYTKGDLLAASAATTLTKLAVGTDTQVLTADAAEVTGIKWAAAGGFNLTVEDIDAVPTYANLTKISFDQADGFVITNPVGTEAQIDLAAIPTSVLAGPITAAKGGTNIDTSASTGVPIVDTGTWTVPATLSVAKGGTNTASYAAKGDILVSSGATTLTKLAVGTDDQVLTAASAEATGVKWAAASGGNTTLTKVTADTVATAATETTIFTFSVAGGTLSTNNMLRLTLVGQIQGGAAADYTATIRLKYGATTMATGTFKATDWSNSFVANLPANTGVTFIGNLAANGATNAQVATLQAECAKVFAWDSTGTLVLCAGRFNTATTARGTAAEDSTLAKTLAVTLQWSTAVAANTYTMEYATLEKLA